jgi:hypothetical protein
LIERKEDDDDDDATAAAMPSNHERETKIEAFLWL